MERFREATWRGVREWEDPVVTGVMVGCVVLVWAVLEAADVGMMSLGAGVLQAGIAAGLACKAFKVEIDKYKEHFTGMQANETLRLARPHLRDAIAYSQLALTWSHPAYSAKVTACLTVCSLVSSYVTSLDFVLLVFLAVAFAPLITKKVKPE